VDTPLYHFNQQCDYWCVSESDTQFINNRISAYNETNKQAIQVLLVSELSRRLRQTREILGEQMTILIYADVWDSEHHGGIPKVTSASSLSVPGDSSFSYCIRTADGLLKLPGLPEEQKEKFRNSIIFMPWAYSTSSMQINPGKGIVYRHEYSPEKAFHKFNSHSFKCIYVHEIRPGNKPVPKHRKVQERRWIEAGKAYPTICLGFNAGAFTPWADSPNTPLCYQSIERLGRGNACCLPSHDYTDQVDKKGRGRSFFQRILSLFGTGDF